MRNLVQRDDLDGALFGAGAAIGALFGIDGGEEIGDGDGAGGANLRTFGTFGPAIAAFIRHLWLHKG